MQKRFIPRHIKFKLQKIKGELKNLERSQRRQKVIYRGAKITIACDFFSETTQAGREWSEIFKVLRDKRIKKFFTL